MAGRLADVEKPAPRGTGLRSNGVSALAVIAYGWEPAFIGLQAMPGLNPSVVR